MCVCVCVNECICVCMDVYEYICMYVYYSELSLKMIKLYAISSNKVLDTNKKRVELFNQRVINYTVNLLWIFIFRHSM